MKKVSFEWVYDPKSFFENEVVMDNDQFLLKINNGIAKLQLKNFCPDIDLSHQKYSNYIESYFISQMIDNRIIYEIKEGSTTIEHEDGHREIFLKTEPFNIKLSSSTKISMIKRDKNGNIIYDSEEEEKKNQQDFLLKIQNVIDKNPIVSPIIKSYKNSILHPNNELVYLYEIREAINTYFSGKPNATKRLKISNKDWSDLGRICNDLPLKQGRHRGKMIGTLRDATQGELEKAREISKRIIHSFIHHLNHNPGLSHNIP